MIIFGTRTRVSTTDTGTFACLRCGAGQRYERKRARRWFTLYFIPVFPVGDLGEFVECGLCHGTFKTEVLALRLPVPDQSVEVEFKRAMLRAAALHLPAGAPPERVAQACEAYRQMVSLPVAEGELLREQQGLSAVDATMYFTNFAKHLSVSQRERLLTLAARVARGGGAPDPAQLGVLTSFGGMLGLSEAHVRGVLTPEAPAASA